MYVCMFTAMDTPITPVVRKVWEMETEFTEGEQIVVKLRPKSNKGVYSLYIPAKGNQANKRVEIVFSKAMLEGLSEDFAEFVAEQFRSVMGKWKNIRSMCKWVKNDRHTWKESVRSAWGVKCERVTRNSVARKLLMKSPATASPVYSAKKDSTVTIVAPHIFGHRGTVRVWGKKQRVSANGRVVKAKVVVWLPLPIRKEYSMGVQFGNNKRWIEFVGEYVNYAVSKWQTLETATNWATNCFKDFREFVNVLFDKGGYHNVSVKRVWRLAPSTMETDPVYNTLGNKGDPDFAEFKDGSNPGFGIFCTVRGRHTFDWAFPNDARINYIANKKTEHLTDLQKKYQATACREDLNLVWVPTTAALKCGAVPVQYVMNHSRKDPTHDLAPHDITGGTVLMPLEGRESVPKEEYRFHYRLLKSKDDTEVQNRVLLRAADAVSADAVSADTVDADAVDADDELIADPVAADAVAADAVTADDVAVPVRWEPGAMVVPGMKVRIKRSLISMKVRIKRSLLPFGHKYFVFFDVGSSSDAHDVTDTKTQKVAVKTSRADRSRARAARADTNPHKKNKTSRADRARARAARADTNPHKKNRRISPARPSIGKNAGIFTDVAEGVYHDPVDGRDYEIYDYMRDPKHRAGVGQCMFVAIEDQLAQPGSERAVRSYHVLRARAVSNQLAIVNSPHFVPGVHRSRAACDRMKAAGTYGDDPELAALRHELMVNIRILRDENGQQCWQWYGEVIDSRPTIRIAHTYRSPLSRVNHYMSLRVVPQVVEVDEGTTYKL